jgi:hypothetical protein
MKISALAEDVAGKEAPSETVTDTNLSLTV